MTPCTKSSLLNCLPGMPGPGFNDGARDTTVLVLDMAAVIHMVKPTRANVFGEYNQKHLIPFLESQINSKCIRIDGVWDRYHEDSLKAQTRVKRGECHGKRKRVATNIPIPKGADWQFFF